MSFDVCRWFSDVSESLICGLDAKVRKVFLGDNAMLTQRHANRGIHTLYAKQDLKQEHTAIEDLFVW